MRAEALALVQQHRAAGDQLVIVTATNEFVTGPIAQAFGVEELIAVRLERGPDGWITGEIVGVPSLREGKVTRLGQWLAARGLGWADVEVTFYSDSTNDLPLLEAVDHPVATNPDVRLRAIAGERGWRILDLFKEK
jgi:HAD superfamily hydrolase (TIGR01490 family)